MRVVELRRRVDEPERDAIVGFVDELAAHHRRRPLSDHLWLDLQSGGQEGFVSVTARDQTGLIGFAQISAGNDAASLEVVTRPDLVDAVDVTTDLADTAIDAFRRNGGGRLQWWLDDPDDRLVATAGGCGLSLVRRLHEMRRSLPHERSSQVATRPFRPGVDDDAWLAVNNRAFAGHAEQGGWTRERLALRISEPWFDPNGFRLYERDGDLVAFCWTKVHHEFDPVVGEIYVIAVDPAAHGTGLGAELTLAGLDVLAASGISTVLLYVDADNATAIGLYDALGFSVHHTRYAYAADLPPMTAGDDPGGCGDAGAS